MSKLPTHHKSGEAYARDDSTTPFESHAAPTYRDFRLWLEGFDLSVVVASESGDSQPLFIQKIDRYWEEGADGQNYLMTAIHIFVNSFPPDPPLRTDDAGNPLSPRQWAELPWKERNFWGGTFNKPSTVRDEQGWLAHYGYQMRFLTELVLNQPDWFDLYEHNVMLNIFHSPQQAPNYPDEPVISEPIPIDQIESVVPEEEGPVPRIPIVVKPTTTTVPPTTTTPPPVGTTVPPTTTTTPPTTTVPWDGFDDRIPRVESPTFQTTRPKAGIAGLLEDSPAYDGMGSPSAEAPLEPWDGWEGTRLHWRGPTATREGDFDWVNPVTDEDVLNARNAFYHHTYQDPATRGIEPQPGLWDKIKIKAAAIDSDWENKSVKERFQWIWDAANDMTRPFQAPIELNTLIGHNKIGVGSWALHFGSAVMQDMYDKYAPSGFNQVAEAEPLVVLKEKFTQEEYNNLYRNLRKTDPELAKAMGTPAGSPFVSGDAVIVGYRRPTVIDRARKLSGRYGVEIDPDYPWIMSKIGSRRVTDTRNRLFQMMDSSLHYSDLTDSEQDRKEYLEKDVASLEITGRANIPRNEGIQQLRIEDLIFNAALKAWGDPSIAVTMTAVALAESNGNLSAVGDNGASLGAWQINDINTDVLGRNDIVWGEDLFGIDANAQAAAVVGQTMGDFDVDLSRWSVTHIDEQGNPAATRWYGDFAVEAEEAAARAGYSDVTGDFLGRRGSTDQRSHNG